MQRKSYNRDCFEDLKTPLKSTHGTNQVKVKMIQIYSPTRNNQHSLSALDIAPKTV